MILMTFVFVFVIVILLLFVFISRIYLKGRTSQFSPGHLYLYLFLYLHFCDANICKVRQVNALQDICRHVCPCLDKAVFVDRI